jgi:hypothetical protein
VLVVTLGGPRKTNVPAKEREAPER